MKFDVLQPPGSLKSRGIGHTCLEYLRRGANSFGQSIAAGGGRIELPAITGIATSLGVRKVCERVFQWSQEHPALSEVVSDAAAVSACNRFVDDHRIATEPACGASLAVLYEGLPVLETSESVLVIVCAGATAQAGFSELGGNSASYRPLAMSRG